MPRENLTDICMLLDRTGSMSIIRIETITNVNAFVAEQRNLEDAGDCRFSLVQFDKFQNEPVIEVIRNRVPIADVPDLHEGTYEPRGWTPLIDAMAMTIRDYGKWLADLDEEDRPAKVVFVVMTDGEENSSTEFKVDQLKKMVETQEKDYDWKFIFLGANIDAIAVGGSYGTQAAATADFMPTGQSVGAAMHSTASNVAKYRQTGDDQSLNYTDAQRQKMKGDDDA